MEPHMKPKWDGPLRNNKRTNKKQLPKKAMICAAVSLCLGAVIYAAIPGQQAEMVMSHLTAGFEYDETLGRLQYVSNILPESTMVFLSSDSAFELSNVVPESAQTAHAWSQNEPWLEYSVVGNVDSCSDGEIMSVIENEKDSYTVRISHQDGYESVYSGLSCVHASEGDIISAGEQIGTAAGAAAFELRKDGLSIHPKFDAIR